MQSGAGDNSSAYEIGKSYECAPFSFSSPTLARSAAAPAVTTAASNCISTIQGSKNGIMILDVAPLFKCIELAPNPSSLLAPNVATPLEIDPPSIDAALGSSNFVDFQSLIHHDPACQYALETSKPLSRPQPTTSRQLELQEERRQQNENTDVYRDPACGSLRHICICSPVPEATRLSHPYLPRAWTIQSKSSVAACLPPENELKWMKTTRYTSKDTAWSTFLINLPRTVIDINRTDYMLRFLYKCNF
ncbi:hypothetical protein KM043_015906 [Ampulex compressa]|nr:hypothetical protein KM043_015906 [Ampulex compressa]